VTGVSTRIGPGTTKVLVSNGFRVFGSVPRESDVDGQQREFGSSLVSFVIDITDAEAVHRAAQHVGSMIANKTLIGLVNNAGMVLSGPLLYLRATEYGRQLETEKRDPFRCDVLERGVVVAIRLKAKISFTLSRSCGTILLRNVPQRDRSEPSCRCAIRSITWRNSRTFPGYAQFSRYSRKPRKANVPGFRPCLAYRRR
jgi:hypothetical protein